MYYPKLLNVLIMAVIVLTGCDGKKEADPKTLTIGTSADYAPFEYFKSGEIVGFDIDLMREIAKRLHKDVVFKDLSFDAILGSLSAERIEGAISALTPTDERRKSIDFTNEYIQENHVLICNGTSSFETVADLAEETLGVQSGTTHENYASDSLSKIVSFKIKSLPKIPDLIENMNARRISGVILGASEAESVRKSRGNIKIIPLPGEVGGYAIALPKGSPLTEKINTVLNEMENDGSLAALKERWLDKP